MGNRRRAGMINQAVGYRVGEDQVYSLEVAIAPEMSPNRCKNILVVLDSVADTVLTLENVPDWVGIVDVLSINGVIAIAPCSTSVDTDPSLSLATTGVGGVIDLSADLCDGVAIPVNIRVTFSLPDDFTKLKLVSNTPGASAWITFRAG